jgi:hypothetical protein
MTPIEITMVRLPKFIPFERYFRILLLTSPFKLWMVYNCLYLSNLNLWPYLTEFELHAAMLTPRWEHLSYKINHVRDCPSDRPALMVVRDGRTHEGYDFIWNMISIPLKSFPTQDCDPLKQPSSKTVDYHSELFHYSSKNTGFLWRLQNDRKRWRK